MRDFLEVRRLKLKDIVHPLRVAVTGKSVGFGLFDTLAILGRDRCLSRLDRAVKLVP
jgi:glutamyl-tRNA synthetase